MVPDYGYYLRPPWCILHLKRTALISDPHFSLVSFRSFAVCLVLLLQCLIADLRSGSSGHDHEEHQPSS